jgi:hypothetical protein
MTDDIEERLAQAAESVREYELLDRRCADLLDQKRELRAQLVALRAQLAEEEADVEWLAGRSFARLLASLRGTRDDDLARERAEADAVRYRIAEVEARHEEVWREHERARSRRARLSTASASYAALLDEKDRHLRESGDDRAPRLLALADERGRLTTELRELEEAVRAAVRAGSALMTVQSHLDEAEHWSTRDTYGGGAFSSLIKNEHLDDAANAAAHADRCLAVLRTELADVASGGPTVPDLAVDGLTRFADVWLDNILTDWVVGNRITAAQANVGSSLRMVNRMQGGLEQRAEQTRERLAAIEDARRELLAD